MNNLFAVDEWKLTETELHPAQLRRADALLSLGNGRIRVDGAFEEGAGSAYLAGVWTKEPLMPVRPGEPEFCGTEALLSLAEIGVSVGDERIDLHTNEILSFRRELDMQRGVLSRVFSVRLAGGEARCETERFVSAKRPEIMAVRYCVTPSFDTEITFTPAVSAAGWLPVDAADRDGAACLIARTKEAAFTVCCAFGCGGGAFSGQPGRAARTVSHAVRAGETAEIVKIIAADFVRGCEADETLRQRMLDALRAAETTGYAALREEHEAVWRERWQWMDQRVKNNAALQQGVRLELFRMLCAYGDEGTVTSVLGWETDLFGVPAMLALQGEQAAYDMVRRRYEQLPKAIENAKRLGCRGALFAMETFDGEECCADAPLSMTAVHRNAAVFYAVWYVFVHTANRDFLRKYGMPILLEICRFWESRLTYHPRRRKFMMQAAIGPNEYEMNVDNNWYINRMIAFCMESFIALMRDSAGSLCMKAQGLSPREVTRFLRISQNMYLHEDRDGIFVQQDGFMDKELKPAAEIDPADLPVEKHWSWDRVLRSCCLSRADVLLGLYCLRHLYPLDAIRRNFDFYEPMTLHGDANSMGVHAALAAWLGYDEKAMELFTRCAREQDGGRFASYGCWLALVKGFAGASTEEGALIVSPCPPEGLGPFTVRFWYQDRLLEVDCDGECFTLSLVRGVPLFMLVYDRRVFLRQQEPWTFRVLSWSEAQAARARLQEAGFGGKKRT